ncbi:MAG: hypothetical protein WC881_03330 [Elusimicrobiota bacterium]|jgi:hypothetical protein
MNPDTGSPKRFITAGAQRCADRLSRICRAPWTVERTASGPAAQERFEPLFADITEDHFGTYISLPDTGVMVMFDRRSGLQVSHRFSGDFTDQIEALDEPQPAVLGEVASMLANSLAEGLAPSGGPALLVSAPQSLIENPRGLLQAAWDRLQSPERPGLPGYIRLACPGLRAETTLIVFLPPDFS